MSVNAIAEEKQMLREHYKKMRSKMAFEYKHKLDTDIQSRVLCLPEYMDAGLVLTYAAMPDEVETRGIIHASLANSKMVAVPYCNPDKTLSFYNISSLSQLRAGRYGIMEPDISACTRIDDLSCSVCIVPGVSFDPEGKRLGNGGGYYDRFLAEYGGVSVGVCYNSFIRWSIPSDRYDMKVDILVTELFVR